jgi:peptide/nickel transport system substrate-binding protein
VYRPISHVTHPSSTVKRAASTKAAAIAFLLAAFTTNAGCQRGRVDSGTGTPTSTFQGQLPEEPYVYTGEPGAYGGTLVLAQPEDLNTFNPILATATSSSDVLLYHLFRSLIDYRNGDDPPGFDPGLCSRWEVSPDAKHWTFYLRRGVRWSDGHSFTADDVLFSYDVIRDEKVTNPIRDLFLEGQDVGEKGHYPALEKLDEYTVRFNLHRPNGGFLDPVFNLPLIPKHKWEQAWNAGRFAETMRVSDNPSEVVGLGPFRIREYVPGQRIVLERNPYFWKVDAKGNRLPYLDRIVFIIARDFNTVVAKFAAGEIDVMDNVRAEDYALVKRMQSSDIKVEDIGVSLNTVWMTLNQNTGAHAATGRPNVEAWKLRLFRNQLFRQALSYAIDRQGLIRTVYDGRAVPIYSNVTPGDRFWYSDDVAKYQYDPDRSRQMLAEMGLKDTNGDGLLENTEGHTVEINVNTNISNSQRVDTAVFITRNLRSVGIKANPVPLSLNSIASALGSTFDFDAIILGWVTGVPPGPSKNSLLSSGYQHACFPNQKEPSTEWEARIDQLVHQIDESPDNAERKRLYAIVQRIWSEQLPEINLVAQREAIAYKNKFGNLHPSTLPPRVTWNCEEIYVKAR